MFYDLLTWLLVKSLLLSWRSLSLGQLRPPDEVRIVIDLARQPSNFFQASDQDIGPLSLSAKASDLQSTQALKLQGTHGREYLCMLQADQW